MRTIGAESLDLDTELLGLNGSPTRVVKIEKPKVTRQGEIIDANKLGAAEAAARLADFLEEKNAL